MTTQNYIFGPVASRRLGLSLGVDVIPYKICTLDCVYCEVGRTSNKTIERKEYISIQTILTQLKQRLNQGIKADYISLCGSGEPTLNSRLGDLIDEIRNITSIPIAIITNGTLLYKQDVRNDCAKADVVLPSLDAGTMDAYKKINRPHKELSVEQLIHGMELFRKQYPGKIWLELFFTDNINTDTLNIEAIRSSIKRINPDKIQLNTAVRPTAVSGINPMTKQKLMDIAEKIGNNSEIIASFSKDSAAKNKTVNAQDILAMLKRRPCSLTDISTSMGITQKNTLTCLKELKNHQLITEERQGEIIYYKYLLNK